jgi:hypothetical protein
MPASSVKKKSLVTILVSQFGRQKTRKTQQTKKEPRIVT